MLLTIAFGFTPASNAVELSVGVGVAAFPDAPGSEDWRVLPAPSFQLDVNGYQVRTQGPGLAFDLVPSNRLSLGPVVRYSGGRSDEDVAATNDNLPTVPASVETGLTMGSGIPWRVIGVPLPGIAVAQVGAFTTLAGGHEGPFASASIGWVVPVTDRWSVITNLGGRYFSDAYADRFFSLDTEAAEATGLDPFEAEAGWQDVSVSMINSYRWAPRWSVFTLVSLSRYQGDAAESPITRALDNRDRYTGVIGINYQWLTD